MLIFLFGDVSGVKKRCGSALGGLKCRIRILRFLGYEMFLWYESSMFVFVVFVDVKSHPRRSS